MQHMARSRSLQTLKEEKIIKTEMNKTERLKQMKKYVETIVTVLTLGYLPWYKFFLLRLKLRKWLHRYSKFALPLQTFHHQVSEMAHLVLNQKYHFHHLGENHRDEDPPCLQARVIYSFPFQVPFHIIFSFSIA